MDDITFHKNGGSYTFEQMEKEAQARAAAEAKRAEDASALAASREKPAVDGDASRPIFRQPV